MFSFSNCYVYCKWCEWVLWFNEKRNCFLIIFRRSDDFKSFILWNDVCYVLFRFVSDIWRWCLFLIRIWSGISCLYCFLLFRVGYVFVFFWLFFFLDEVRRKVRRIYVIVRNDYERGVYVNWKSWLCFIYRKRYLIFLK